MGRLIPVSQLYVSIGESVFTFVWVFFKSVVFAFKGEKLKNMKFFFTVSKIILSLLFQTKLLKFLDDLELSVLEEICIFAIIFPKI